jgi:ubiquinone/menaquinone biosynthesis C-methylase UbiE
MPHPSNYFGHEAEYVRRRAAGNPGWDTARVIAENLALLDEVFVAEHMPKGGRLVELGCGAGDLSLWAAERGYQVDGIDISPFAIAWAKEKASDRGLKAHFQVGSVLDLTPYGADSFEIVLDGHCFHCIIGDDRPRFLEESFRVLKPGGVLHLNTMCGDPSPGQLARFDAATRNIIHRGAAVRHLGLPEDIEGEVAAAGFTILARRCIPRLTDAEDDDTLLIDATKR